MRRRAARLRVGCANFLAWGSGRSGANLRALIGSPKREGSDAAGKPTK